MEDEISIRREDLPKVTAITKELAEKGFQWFAWGNVDGHLSPRLMDGFPTRELAEDHCWVPEKPGSGLQAVTMKDLATLLANTVSMHEGASELPRMIVLDLQGFEQVEPEKTFRQERYDRMKGDLERLGANNSDTREQLRTGILKDEEDLPISYRAMQDHHPLDVHIAFQKNGENSYGLKELAVSGILIPDGIVNGVELDDLQKRMSKVTWGSSLIGPDEKAAKEKILQDLLELRKSPQGKSLTVGLFLKYIDPARHGEPHYFPDVRRPVYESRLVFSMKEGFPLKVEEALGLFLGKSEGRKPDRKAMEEIRAKRLDEQRPGVGRLRGR